jgi:predicted aspartyl protease
MVGLFAVDIEVARPADRPSFTGVRGLLVDTGSDATWVSAVALRQAGVQVRWKDVTFIMANGAQVTRDVGYAIIRCGEFETIDEVVFARKDDLQLLGARTLEGFNARVDPRKKQLVAGGPRPAAADVGPGRLARSDHRTEQYCSR